MANPTSNVRLFEVNLIGDRISSFFRRRAFQKWCMAGALVMLLIAAVMAVRVGMHLSAAFGINSAIRADTRLIQKEQEQLASLDTLRQDALAHVKNLAPLMPIAEARVCWAPKFAALASAFPPGASLMAFHGSQGDLFGALATAHPSAENLAAGVKITFSVSYAATAGSEGNPIALVKKLRESKDFLRHVDRVGLDSLEQDTWQGSPIVILRGSAEGARSH